MNSRAVTASRAAALAQKQRTKKAAAAAFTTSHHERHYEERHDVDDLDQRVHRRAGGVLVRIAHRVAGDGRLVRLGTLAAVVAVLDVLLRVVPGAAAGAHRDRDEEARH